MPMGAHPMIDTLFASVKLAGLWLLLTVLGAWVSALAYPLLRRGLAPLAPDLRSLARLAWGLMPPVAATLVLVLLSIPAAGYLVPEHCHGGVCGAHAPEFGGGTSMGVLAAAAGSVAAVAALSVMLFRGLRSVGRRVRSLEHLSRAEAGRAYRVIESPVPFAFCAGFLSSRLLVSRGLIDRLSGAQLDAVVAHERAHAHRRDNLRSLLLQLATAPWPAVLRRSIREDMAADHEYACDRIAAERVGSRRTLGEALAGVASVAGAPVRSAGFGSVDPVHRLAALDQSFRPLMSVHGLCVGALLLGAWTVLVTAQMGVSHGLVEWLGSLAT